MGTHLNETRYPLDFALKALEITKEEYPYPGRPVAAADVHSAGVKEHYDVVYGWPGDDEKEDKPEQCIFTREFGENVDDWYAAPIRIRMIATLMVERMPLGTTDKQTGCAVHLVIALC